MTMTDPIADMLTRLRNANQAYHDQVAMPYSKIKANIAEILKAEGYIAAWTVEEPEEGAVGKTLVVELKYGPNRERSIAGIRRVSKPGLRVYAKSTELPTGARRPRRRDHLDVQRAADRPAGPQAGGGRGSPRLRLVRETAKMSRIGRCRSPCPPASTSPSTARRSRSRAQGRAVATPSPSRSRSSAARTAQLLVSRPERRAQGQGAARPDPHAGRQHGRRRHRGLQQDAWRSSAPVTASRPRARTSSSRSGFCHPVLVTAPDGHHLHGRAADPVPRRRHRQAAGRRGRRQHPQDPQARPVQGQGRASTRARSSAARPERRVRSERHAAQAPPRRRRASAPSGGRVGTSGSARRSPAPPSVRAWSSPARCGTSPPSSSTTPSATRWRRRRRWTPSLRGAEGDKTRPGRARSARCSPSGPRPPASPRSSSTAAATGTPGGSPRSPTPPAKPGWSSRNDVTR